MEAPEDIEAWSSMSVAEEVDVPLNGSKDITLAVSASEPKHMSTLEVICDQDIGGWGGGEVGEMSSSWVFFKGGRGVYIVGKGTGS